MSTSLKPLSELNSKDQAIIKEILAFWFGDVELTAMPSADRLNLWFGYEPSHIHAIQEKFEHHIKNAVNGLYNHWLESIRGQLALILLLDQFTKIIYKKQAEAYQYDPIALELCVINAALEEEHDLSLIERAFYYFPLMRAEDLHYSDNAVHVYDLLVHYALPETKAMYEKFLDMAIQRAKIIRAYGRYPTRNALLGRESTQDELLFLNQIQDASIV